jgi:diguanylate cyclase (GGDEF)-like protein
MTKTKEKVRRFERQSPTVALSLASSERQEQATERDRVAEECDHAAAEQDRVIQRLAGELGRAPRTDQVIEALERMCAKSAADRERAAGDREAAAVDREHYVAELNRAHLDDLTGAYRRGMGRIALVHEIERARRSEGALVFAYIDCDGLKDLNNRDGHAAGDTLLRDLVTSMRAKLRPYDPIVRWGGDEFICTISDAGLEAARRRIEEIADAFDAVHPGASVTVGLATLGEGDTLETLMERADAALLEARLAR